MSHSFLFCKVNRKLVTIAELILEKMIEASSNAELRMNNLFAEMHLT